MKQISRAAFAQWQSSIFVASQFQCRVTYNLAHMSVSGSATISFSAWNSMITRFAKTIGMILMIAPARITNGPSPNLAEPLSKWARSAKSTYTIAGRFDTTASVKTSATDSSCNSSAGINLVGIRLVCSGRSASLPGILHAPGADDHQNRLSPGSVADFAAKLANASRKKAVNSAPSISPEAIGNERWWIAPRRLA